MPEKKLILDVLQELEVKDSVVTAFAKVEYVIDLGKKRTDAEARIAELAPGDAAVRTGLLAAWDSEKRAATDADAPATDQKKTIEQALSALVTAGKCTADAKQKLLRECATRKLSTLNDLLGSTKPAAETKLTEVLKAAGLAANAEVKVGLVDAWAAENPTAAPGKDDTAKEQPKVSTTVPPGKIDLSTFPRLSAEHEGKLTLFQLPSQFVSKAGGEYLTAADLDEWQWLFLANNLTLTKAFDLRKTMLPGSNDPFATRAAFVWEKKGVFRNDIVGADTYDETQTAVTIEESALHSNMVVGGSLSGGIAFCPVGTTPCYLEASLKVQYTADQQTAAYSKRVYGRACSRRDKARLVLQNCLSPAPEFEYILETAFKKFKADDALFDALEQIFDEFGHYVPATVTLGGVMYFEIDVVSLEGQTTQQIKESLSSTIKFKFGEKAKGETTVGYDKDTYSKITASSYSDRHMTSTKGGNDQLNGEPFLWKATVDDPRTWKVIAREGVTPIARILQRSRLDLYNQLEAAAQRKRMAAWGVTDPALLPSGWDFPPFPAGHLLTLCNMDGRERKDDRSFLVARNGCDDVPDAVALSEGKDIRGNSLPPSSLLREQDYYYPNCQKAPLRSTNYAFGDDPKQNDLLWTFECVWKDSADREPRFWIVSSDRQWVLSAFSVLNYAAFASLYPYAEEVKRRNQTTPAQWMLRAALQVGRVTIPDERGDWTPDSPLPPSRGYFRIFNPYYKSYLADEALMNSHRRFYTNEEVTVHAGGPWGPAPSFSSRKTVQVMNCSLFSNASPEKQEGVWKKRADLIQMRRTMLRVDAAPAAANVQAGDGERAAYKSQCWRIRDWSDRPRRMAFDELSQLDGWIAERQAKMPKDLMKPSGT